MTNLRYEKVHLIGLIGLRALAEYDLAEYNRVTSFSKRELDNKIRIYLDQLQDPELSNLYGDFSNSVNVSESPNELQFLMKQIHRTCMQKAQHLALQLMRQNPKEKSDSIIHREKEGYDYLDRAKSPHDEFTRLAVMLLLKELRGYEVKFNYRIKNLELDALLQPKLANMPYIVLETKMNLASLPIDKAIRQLSSVMKFWGKDSFGIILTPMAIRISNIKLPSNRIYNLIFDQENNIFESLSEREFFNAINQEIKDRY